MSEKIEETLTWVILFGFGKDLEQKNEFISTMVKGLNPKKIVRKSKTSTYKIDGERVARVFVLN